MSKHRCIHPDCEYRHRDESKGGHEYVPNGCDYASITGKSRIAQLPPAMWDPALCPLYKPRAEGEERKKAPITLIPQRPKGPREWEEKARALWAAGKMDTEIAAALNISPPTVRLFREKNNLPRNVYHRERFRFDKKLALELYKAGRSDAEIANKVGCSRGTIGEWRKAEGLPANVNRPVPQSHMDWDKARRLYDQGKSDSEIAQALGCCKQYVAKWRRKNGLETRTAVQTFDWQLARELYEQGKTDREIAQALGCVYQTVSEWRKKNDLPRNVYHRERFRFDKKLAMELYKAGRSDAEIANKVGCSRGTIGEWRKAEGLPANVNRPVPQSHMDWDKARRLYDQGKSDSEIAQALGCVYQTVSEWRKKNDLPSKFLLKREERKHERARKG